MTPIARRVETIFGFTVILRIHDRGEKAGVRILAIEEKFFENRQNQNWELGAEKLHRVPQSQYEKKHSLRFTFDFIRKINEN